MWLERLLLTAGIVCVGIWAASKLVPEFWQAWANRVFDLAVRNAPPSGAPAAPLETGHLIGRLSIPRLHVSSIVREGDDDTTLSLALGHIPGTALPGQAGNVGVAGHRDTIFRALKGIQKDDVIRFETVSGTRMYQVDSTRIVKPSDVDVLASHGGSALTLVTCYPFYYVGSAPDRFIVSAHELSKREMQAATNRLDAKSQAPEAAAAMPVRPAALHSSVLHPAEERDRPGGSTNVIFDVLKGHGEEIAPGISLGVTDTDPLRGRVYGWVWLAADHRSVMLRAQPAGEPVVFYEDGHRRELRFTAVSDGSARGTLSAPAE